MAKEVEICEGMFSMLPGAKIYDGVMDGNDGGVLNEPVLARTLGRFDGYVQVEFNSIGAKGELVVEKHWVLDPFHRLDYGGGSENTAH